MGLSIRAYARHRGVSHVAVKKAIDTGRISQETDGTINPEQADREWQQNTASPRKPSPAPKIPATPKPARSVAQEPATETPTPTLSAGGTSLLQARTVNEVVKAQTNKVRLARLKGEVLGRIAQADETGVFAKGDVETPVQAVLNAPVSTHGMQDAATVGGE